MSRPPSSMPVTPEGKARHRKMKRLAKIRSRVDALDRGDPVIVMMHGTSEAIRVPAGAILDFCDAEDEAP